MEISQYLSLLENKGIRLSEQEGRIKYHAPKGAMTTADIAFLKLHKEEILADLMSKQQQLTLKPDPKSWFEPFPLTNIQEAYLLGRTTTYQYGGVSCHIYLEMEYPSLEAKKVETIWNALIARHGMLKTTFDLNGFQQELKTVPFVPLTYVKGEEERDMIRQTLSHKVYSLEQWPLFDVALSKTPENSILHYSTEFLIVDWTSIWRLLGEFEAIYFQDRELPFLQLHFRDYVIAEKKHKSSERYQIDRTYWIDKIKTLPAAPQMPRLPLTKVKNTFKRLQLQMDRKQWEQIKQQCQAAGITPASFILTVYAKVLAYYSETSTFCINMILLHRLPLHEDVEQIIGDFTSNTLIAIDLSKRSSLQQEITAINQTIFEALDHGLFSGVEILRELSRKNGRESAFMPIIFTSALGVSKQSAPLLGKIGHYGISQTPQAFIDCQVMDGEFGFRANWDIREGIFPDGYIEDMFTSFQDCLCAAAKQMIDWQECYRLTLPDWQQIKRAQVNATSQSFPAQTLHGLVLNQAQKTPAGLAVSDGYNTLDYQTLINKSLIVAQALHSLGCQTGDRVAIIMPPNAYQIIAVLGILCAGGVYVPVDDGAAFERTEQILKNADITIVLVHSHSHYQANNRTIIQVDQLSKQDQKHFEIPSDPQLPAYIIHTSGSTGLPKGVVITHQAAANTIFDINERFTIGPADRILALSQLPFDLSVYDIFGLLSRGGAVIYPDQALYKDPAHWVSLIQQHQITVWNTVPSLMVMLQEYMQTQPDTVILQLRIVLLSGDWIPLLLPQKITHFLPHARVISLGGATEASIWSILHECQAIDPDWTSIPYGTPLANQAMHVYNDAMEDCPVWLKGELYISGEGLALEYHNNEERTQEQFFYLPSLGKRVYRTGDWGRYLPTGEIEFMGRMDSQVKILGFRIELGEIEIALRAAATAHTAIVTIQQLGETRKIVASVFGNSISLSESQIKEQLHKKLPAYMIPYRIFLFSELPMTDNGKIDRPFILKTMADQLVKSTPSQEPEFPLETSLALQQLKDLICPILGIEQISLTDDFYELGADSLMMNRMAVALTVFWEDRFSFEELLVQLLNYSNLAALYSFAYPGTSGKEHLLGTACE